MALCTELVLLFGTLTEGSIFPCGCHMVPDLRTTASLEYLRLVFLFLPLYWFGLWVKFGLSVMLMPGTHQPIYSASGAWHNCSALMMSHQLNRSLCSVSYAL